MTLRDYFAGQALVGVLASPKPYVGASDVYEIAEAVLKAREKE